MRIGILGDVHGRVFHALAALVHDVERSRR
jgi:hypothetical protein